ncbi:MAG: ABC transporter permease subunit [Candidatus Riflebacteria bacterium]
MINSLFKNFFGIRIEVNAREKIILGVVPIFMLLFIWSFVTSGNSTTIEFPEGQFEGFESNPPPVGHFFREKIRYTIDQATLDYSDEFSTILIKGRNRLNLGMLPARASANSVRITLPPGKIVGRNLPESAKEETASGSATVENSSGAVDITSVDQPKPSASFGGTITYKFEVVESRLISQVILPSPSEVFRSLPSLWVERSLLTNILYSFLRVGAGFFVAFIIVFPVSLLMGTYSKFHALFAPLMMFGGYLPIPALVPLTMVLFGTTEQQKIMFLALGFAIYLLPLFVKALEEVDNVYLQTGLTLGARKFQILNNILLPIALPKIFDAMRLGFGIGWGYIILAEMVDMGSKGVGTLILTSQRRGPREDIYLVLIAIVIMAFITDKIWEKVGDRLFPYRSQKR